MKKVINGRRWDTEKANLVCEVENGMPRDLGYVKARLYQTPRSKRYFLAGEGGPMTIFAHAVTEGTLCGGEKIIPLTTEQARNYAELYPAETVKRFFVIKEA
jgi:hypothetical protein